jgi:WD40 repeat protein/tRNA A-37 threonylcarbamoyl transferase component Bud32
VVAGRYKLLELIGEGGMGEVWVADQLDPIRRRVALKMIKPGMDSRSVLARFEAERQALALMDHPNIARVLDAGTTDDGRPFFVMELVKGVPITQFCDARKLSPRERLGLFVPVCQAIQHAHQKGIIHRDIKPTNVLVALHDERAVPKVIDFGVAKAVGQQLTEKTIYTGFGALVGTPAYMAPEQATFNQLDVDTRADVYALGVLLYELLAGSPPFEPERLKRAALDEMLRVVREEEPPPPSARLSTSLAKATIAAVRQSDPSRLAKLMRGELDWVVMKALEKDRTRRYESAAGLAKDVERYLNDEAVEACPPTLGYRLKKACRKNRTAFITTAAVFASVMVAVIGQTWNLLRARAAEADALAAWNAEAEQRDETARQRDAAVEAGKEAERKRIEANEVLKNLRLAQEQQQADQYVWDMQLLPLAFDAGNVAEVNRLLGRHIPQGDRPDRRAFEWHYWHRQLNSDLRTDRLPDVGGLLHTWAASPDGSRVARFSVPGPDDQPPDDTPVLTVWDAATRKVVLTHRMPIQTPVNQTYSSSNPKGPLFSPDGTRVAVEWGFLTPATGKDVGGQYRRQVVDAASGKVLLDLEMQPARPSPGSSYQIDGGFSPDGRRFAAVCRIPGQSVVEPGHVRVWELEGGKEVCPPLDAEALADRAFSPDGTRLVTWRHVRRPHRVSVWDLATGQERVGWDTPRGVLAALAVSPDGTHVAGVTADGSPAPKGGAPPAVMQVVNVWDAASGKELYTLPLAPLGGAAPGSARAFFSPDGSRLAVTRSSASPPPMNSMMVSSTRFGTTYTRPSESSSRMSSVSDLTLCDAATGRPLPPLWGPEGSGVSARGIRGAGFSPDGKQLVGLDGSVLRTWDVQTGEPVLALRGHVTPVVLRSFTPDGRRLWSLEDDGTLKEWDARPPRPVSVSFVASRPAAQLSSLFALSADGGRVAALLDARTADQPSYSFGVRVWDAAGKSVQLLVPPLRKTGPESQLNATHYALGLSRDGRRVVLTRADGAGSGGASFGRARVGKDEPGPPPDVIVWDVDAKAVLLHQQLDCRAILAATISPDGRTVAVVPRPVVGAALTIRLFDVDARRERPPLAGTGLRAVFGASFSPDGRRLVAVGMGELAAERQSPTGPLIWNSDRRPPSKLVVWDLEGGPQPSVVQSEPQGPFPAGAGPLAWASDGSRFAFWHTRRDDSVVEVHDATSGKPLLTLDQPLSRDVPASGPSYLAYSPDGRRIAGYLAARFVGGTPVLKVWDAASGREVLAIRLAPNANAQGAKSLTFTGDGRRLVLAEYGSEFTRSAERGSPSPNVRGVLLRMWDAIPVPDREPKTP